MRLQDSLKLPFLYIASGTIVIGVWFMINGVSAYNIDAFYDYVAWHAGKESDLAIVFISLLAIGLLVKKTGFQKLAELIVTFGFASVLIPLIMPLSGYPIEIGGTNLLVTLGHFMVWIGISATLSALLFSLKPIAQIGQPKLD